MSQLLNGATERLVFPEWFGKSYVYIVGQLQKNKPNRFPKPVRFYSNFRLPVFPLFPSFCLVFPESMNGFPCRYTHIRTMISDKTACFGHISFLPAIVRLQQKTIPPAFPDDRSC